MDEQMDQLLRSLPKVEPPEDLKSKVLRRVAEEHRRRLMPWRVAYIATVLLLAGGGFWLGTALADSYLPDLLPLLIANWSLATDLWTEVAPTLMEGAILIPAAAVLLTLALVMLEARRAAPARVKA